MNLIDLKKLERVAGEKPLRTFTQPALASNSLGWGADAARRAVRRDHQFLMNNNATTFINSAFGSSPAHR